MTVETPWKAAADRGKRGVREEKIYKKAVYFSRFPLVREKSTKNELIKFIKTGKIYEKIFPYC